MDVHTHALIGVVNTHTDSHMHHTHWRGNTEQRQRCKYTCTCAHICTCRYSQIKKHAGREGLSESGGHGWVGGGAPGPQNIQQKSKQTALSYELSEINK